MNSKCLAAMMATMVVTSVAMAEEDGPTVVVTASRNERRTQQIPANATVILAEDIERGGYDNIVDALTGMAGVTVRTTSGNASQAELGMRGFGELSHGRVLVMVDGAKLNRPDQAGINWLQIPLGSIARIEIVRGANTALYGDHAVGGVINIITKKGTPASAGSASMSIGSFNTDTERFSLSGSSGKLSYAIHGDHHETDGYRDRSAYSAWGAGTYLGYDLSDQIVASLSLSYNTLAFELPGDLSEAEMADDPRQSTYPDDSAENEYLNGAAGLNVDLGEYGRLNLGTVLSRKQIQSDLVAWSSFADLQIDTLGISPRYTVGGSLFNCQNDLLVGVDYYSDTLTVQRFAEKAHSTETSAAEIEKKAFGIYARNEMTVGESIILGIGLRREEADVTVAMPGVFNDAKTHTEEAIDVSLLYMFGEDSKVFVKGGTVYRLPFVDEQAAYFGFGSDQLYADIDPETGNSYEIGAEIGEMEDVTIGVAGFLLDMNDEIAFNNATFANENMDNTRRTGVELNLTYDVAPSCAIKASYTYVDATFTAGANDGKDIPLTPDSMASIGIDMGLPHDLSLGAQVRYVDGSYLGGDNANDGPKLKDYMVTDVSLRYTREEAAEGKRGLRDGMEAFVLFENVFDKEYSSIGYMNAWSGNAYYPLPGRSVKAGVTFRF